MSGSVTYHRRENFLVENYHNYDYDKDLVTEVTNIIHLTDLDPTIELLEFYDGTDAYEDYDPVIAEIIARCPEIQKNVKEEYEFSLQSESVAMLRFPSPSVHWFALIDGKIYDWNFEFLIVD